MGACGEKVEVARRRLIAFDRFFAWLLGDELPVDRFTFIHSEFDRPYQSAASFGYRVRKWRRDAGLPEGLSAQASN